MRDVQDPSLMPARPIMNPFRAPVSPMTPPQIVAQLSQLADWFDQGMGLLGAGRHDHP